MQVFHVKHLSSFTLKHISMFIVKHSKDSEPISGTMFHVKQCFTLCFTLIEPKTVKHFKCFTVQIVCRETPIRI